jgi:hypothetical protein
MVFGEFGFEKRGYIHLSFFLPHDLIRKPVPTFRDHAASPRNSGTASRSA